MTLKDDLEITDDMMELAVAADTIKSQSWDALMAAIHRSIEWEKAHPWPGHWTVSTTEAYQEYAEEHGHPPVTDDEKREAFLVATLNRLDAT